MSTSLPNPPAPSRADKIAAAIVPDQLDQYLGAGECDLHDVCRNGERQCPYHQALAKGGSSAVAPETTKHPDLVTHHEETP